MITMQDLLLGAIMRAAHIHRYSAIPVNHTESVAEHSFFVAAYADRISIDLNCSMETNRLAVRAALWHDIEETLTGDFIRSFKYSDSKMKAMMDDAAHECAFKVFEEIINDEIKSGQALMIWHEAKRDSLVGKIVKFSDFLSVVAYVSKECAMGNRFAMKMMWYALPDYLKLFQVGGYSEFKPYLDDVQEILKGGWEDVRVTI